MIILGHRGFSAKYFENTETSFRKAFEFGADGIELDTRVTKDGKLVVIHDADLKRLTGKDIKISDNDYDKIKEIKLGEENVPLFDEVLESFPKDKILNDFIKK